MAISHVVKPAISTTSQLSTALDLSSAVKRVGNATISSTPAANSSTSAQISTQALSLYNASVARSAMTTYTVSQALALGSSASAGSLTISDTGANINKGFDRLVAMSPKISAIQQTDAKAFAINEAQFSAGLTSTPSDGLLYKINNNQFVVAISGVRTANLNSIAGYGSKVVAISISDTSANIAGKLADIAALGSKVSAITQTSKSALALSYAGTVQFAGVLNKIDKGSFTINLTDTAGNIKTNIAAITKIGAKVSAITQTDASEVIAMNTASFAAGLPTLKKINNGSYKISIEDTSTAINKSWATLSSNQKNISSLKFNDGTPALTLSAVQVTAGKALINNISNGAFKLTVADSGINISKNLSGLLALNDKITSVSQVKVGNISVTQSQLVSNELTSFLGKLKPTSYSLAVTGADKTNIKLLLKTHMSIRFHCA